MLAESARQTGIRIFPDSGHDHDVLLSETVRKTKEQILRELADMDEIDYQPEPRLSRSAGKSAQELFQVVDGVGLGAAA